MNVLANYQSPDSLPESESIRLALLMDLPEASEMNAVKLADIVAKGLPIKAVNAISPILTTIGRNALWQVVSESTLRRAKNRQRLTRDPSERVYELSRVIDQAATVFHGDQSAIGRFMTRPNPLLDGRTPFDMACASSAGAHTVIRLLQEAKAGVAV